MFLVVPEIVAGFPNVTGVALSLIVRLAFGLPPFGGFAATAGPAQTSTAASAAPIFFIPHKRSRMPRVGAEKEEAPGGASLSACCAGRRSRTRTSARVRGGGCGRRVLELLLGAEKRVERLLAQALAEHKRQADADDDQHQPATAPLRLLRRAQPVRRVLERHRRLAELLLRLLVVERGARALAVRHARISVARGLVGGPQVLAQVL